MSWPCRTFITEIKGVGFIARCICGWENRSAGYDYAEAVAVESTHGRPLQNGRRDT